MKNLLLWVMTACLSIVLALSACQMEETQEILEQPPSSFSGEGSSVPEVPAEVSFVDVEIPDEYLFTGTDAEIGTAIYSVRAVVTEGDTLNGYVILKMPTEVTEELKIVSYQVSSSLAEAVGITENSFVEYLETLQAGRIPCIRACRNASRPLHCLVHCTWDNFTSGVTAFFDGVSYVLD